MLRTFVLTILTLLLLATSVQADQIRLAGMSSWYGGACDGGDNNVTASGVPNTVPGFATRWVPFHTWYLVSDRRGRRAIGMSLERGPASWTGRAIDINYSLAGKLGYRVTRGGCVIGYPNGWLKAEQIVPDLRYPSCGWAARMVGKRLRRYVGRLGRTSNCLYGSAANKLRRFQRAHHRPRAARRGIIDKTTWALLFKARQ